MNVNDIALSSPLPHTDDELIHCMQRNVNIQRSYLGTNLADDARYANRELAREAAVRNLSVCAS